MTPINLILTLALTVGATVSAQEWQSLNFPSPEPITGIVMFNADSGYVTTSDGNFIRTSDRGKNWFRSEEISGTRLESLCFLNPKVGWICGHKGLILFTGDGGHVWTNQSWKDTLAVFFDIEMINQDTGIVVGMRPDDTNKLAAISLKTTDGGKNWKLMEPMGMAYNEALFEPASRKLYFMSMGRLNISSDGARKWHSILTIEGSPARTFSIYGSTGIMAGPKGVCAYSADSGKTWYKNTRGENQHFISSVMVDAKRGYIAGKDGVMLATLDGGRNWLPETLPKSFFVMDMIATGATVYAVGSGGTIIYKNLKQ
jgi:photosystem II stability/assembly factor-like uncharacterized protein